VTEGPVSGVAAYGIDQPLLAIHVVLGFFSGASYKVIDYTWIPVRLLPECFT
jgi:hypothetical protein